jgi:hypothetical protein
MAAGTGEKLDPCTLKRNLVLISRYYDANHNLMKPLFISILVIFCVNAYPQKKLPVYFDVCNDYWRTPKLNEASSIDVLYYDKSCTLQIVLRTYQGSSYVKLYRGDTLIVEGSYVNSLGILRGYSVSRTTDTVRNAEISLIEYYSPLKNGKWKFYQPSGQIAHTDLYDRGVFIKEL